MNIRSTRIIRSKSPITNQFNKTTALDPENIIDIDGNLPNQIVSGGVFPGRVVTQYSVDDLSARETLLTTDSGTTLELIKDQHKRKAKFASAGLKVAENAVERFGLSEVPSVKAGLGLVSLTLSSVTLVNEIEEGKLDGDLVVAGANFLTDVVALCCMAQPNLKPIADIASDVSALISLGDAGYALYMGAS